MQNNQFLCEGDFPLGLSNLQRQPAVCQFRLLCFLCGPAECKDRGVGGIIKHRKTNIAVLPQITFFLSPIFRSCYCPSCSFCYPPSLITSLLLPLLPSILSCHSLLLQPILNLSSAYVTSLQNSLEN